MRVLPDTDRISQTINMSIASYFKKVSSAEEAMPKNWMTDPLPPATKKRAVGRPRKIKEETIETPVPVRVEEKKEDEKKEDEKKEDPPTSEKRGKYTRFSIKEKV